jgi:hypothetical protein
VDCSFVDYNQSILYVKQEEDNFLESANQEWNSLFRKNQTRISQVRK